MGDSSSKNGVLSKICTYNIRRVDNFQHILLITSAPSSSNVLIPFFQRGPGKSKMIPVRTQKNPQSMARLRFLKNL